jgi:hypothetical protein
MKNSTFNLVLVSIILALVVGGIFGYAIAVGEVHKTAVANGVGEWRAVNGYSNEFVWKQGCGCNR